MKQFFLALLVVVHCLPQVVNADTPRSKAVTQEKQSQLTPKRALVLLKEGNQRFLNNQMRDYDFAKEMKMTTKKGQHPIAVMLSCMDSRSIPDFLFDQGLGNLFVSRIAGNVADKDILGSMEFATKLAGARLVVVMGHTHCGAIVGACTTRANTDLENLNVLLGKIKPAVMQVKEKEKPFSCENNDTIDKITKQNVINQLNYIHDHSAAIAKLVKEEQVDLIGAMHDIKQGKVVFFNRAGQEL